MEPAYPGKNARSSYTRVDVLMAPGRWPLRTTLLPRRAAPSRSGPYSSLANVSPQRQAYRREIEASVSVTQGSSSGSQPARASAGTEPSSSPPSSSGSKESSDSGPSDKEQRPAPLLLAGIHGSGNPGLTNTGIPVTIDATTRAREPMFTQAIETPTELIGPKAVTFWIQALTLLCIVSAAALAATALVKFTSNKRSGMDDLDAFGNTKPVLQLDPQTRRPEDNILEVPFFVKPKVHSTTTTAMTSRPPRITEPLWTPELEPLTVESSDASRSKPSDEPSVSLPVFNESVNAITGVLHNETTGNESVETSSAQVEHSTVESSVASSSKHSDEVSALSHSSTNPAENTEGMSSSTAGETTVESSVASSSEHSEESSASSHSSINPAENTEGMSSSTAGESTVESSVASSSEPSEESSASSHSSINPAENTEGMSSSTAGESTVESSVASSSEPSEESSASSHTSINPAESTEGMSSSTAGESSSALSHSTTIAEIGAALFEEKALLAASNTEEDSAGAERDLADIGREGKTAAKRWRPGDLIHPFNEEKMPWQMAGWQR